MYDRQARKRDVKRGAREVIYGEYLFIENFVTGAILLVMTGALAEGSAFRFGLRERKTWIRLAAGSAVCGAGGFLIFWGVPWPLAAAARLAVGVTAVGIFMGGRALTVAKRTVIFLCLTLVSGGAVMVIMLWRQQPAVSGCGAIYINPYTYINLLLWGGAAFGLTWMFVRILKTTRKSSISKGKVCLTIDGLSCWFEALVDSGNSLKEPLTARPVMLMDSKGRAKLEAGMGGLRERESRLVLVPFKAVGVESGLLYGIRADRLEFENKVIDRAVIAFYEGDFGEYEMLLSKEVMDEDVI